MHPTRRPEPRRGDPGVYGDVDLKIALWGKYNVEDKSGKRQQTLEKVLSFAKRLIDIIRNARKMSL